MTTNTLLLSPQVSFHDDQDGLLIKHEQDIPQAHIDALRGEHAYNAQHRATEMHRVASVPVAVVEKWRREGFDIFAEPASAILVRLRRESLDYFITSPKL